MGYPITGDFRGNSPTIPDSPYTLGGHFFPHGGKGMTFDEAWREYDPDDVNMKADRNMAEMFWAAATAATNLRWLGAILAAAGTPMCATAEECVGCGCRSLSPEEALAELREGTR
jgi:hypothetical protein